MKPFELINRMIDLAEPGNFFNRQDLSVRSFGLGDNAVNFTGDNVAKFQEAIESLYAANRDVEHSYTFKEFEKRFASFFHDSLRNNTHIAKVEAKRFFDELKSVPQIGYTVYRPIQGVHLKDDLKRTELGPYQIVHYPTLTDSFPKFGAEGQADLIWVGDTPRYLIGHKATARHQEKALENHAEDFTRFEQTIRYLIGNTGDRFEVGILNYRGATLNKAYVFGPDRPAGSSSNLQGAYESIPLDDPFFINQDAGHKTVWEIVDSSTSSEFKKRVLLALEWIAQAMNETSLASGFIKAAIALEILFTHNEKSIVTPSILSQISENTALLLADTTEDRIELEKEVKKLYSVRSSIVHAGKRDILRDQYVRMLQVSRGVVSTILTRDDLLSLSKIEDLYMLLKGKKFSCGAI